MKNFSFEFPPETLTPELRDYLSRQLATIEEAIKSTSDIQEIHQEPDKSSDGMFRYVGTAGATFTTKGFWGKVNGSWGKIGEEIPAGSRLVFYQSSAPAGWTQVTTLNDRLLRVVSGTGAGVGGTVSPIIAHLHTTAAHTLTVAEMPSHSHTSNFTTNSIALTTGAINTPGGVSVTSTWVNSSGGNGSHTHGNTGSAGIPYYADVIICEKG